MNAPRGWHSPSMNRDARLAWIPGIITPWGGVSSALELKMPIAICVLALAVFSLCLPSKAAAALIRYDFQARYTSGLTTRTATGFFQYESAGASDLEPAATKGVYRPTSLDMHVHAQWSDGSLFELQGASYIAVDLGICFDGHGVGCADTILFAGPNHEPGMVVILAAPAGTFATDALPDAPIALSTFLDWRLPGTDPYSGADPYFPGIFIGGNNTSGSLGAYYMTAWEAHVVPEASVAALGIAALALLGGMRRHAAAT